MWDVEKGKGQGRLTEHCHYVQGVAWDPARTYVVSQSADRTCRQVLFIGLTLVACVTQSTRTVHFILQHCVQNCASGGLSCTAHRVYGPRVAALGKKGKGAQSSLALAKDYLCQSIISKRKLPSKSGAPTPVLCMHGDQEAEN